LKRDVLNWFRYWRPFGLVGLSCLGLLLRIYNVNWDQGNSFQPDEREILFHVTALGWPRSFAQFLNPVTSPLNPHFFAYGSFPIYLLALLGRCMGYTLSAPSSFVPLTLLGRVVSALFDAGSILLAGYLALFLFPKHEQRSTSYAWSVAFLASALVTFTPLQLQLSHFFTVDTILVFFVMLMLLACVALVQTEHPMRWACVASLAYGLALATKFSAVPLIVPLLVALCLRWHQRRNIFDVVLQFVWILVFGLFICLIAQPYMLLDYPNFIQQVSEQGALARGLQSVPYTIQFAGTTPVVYQLRNLVLWGMGCTLGIAALAGVCWLLWRCWKRRLDAWLVLLAWIIVYGAIICSFYVKYMRYLLPLYPVLAVVAAAGVLACGSRIASGIQRISPKRRQGQRMVALINVALSILILGGTIFQGLALLNVYSSPNTRIQASLWIYQHLPAGSVLTYEQWDDPLPFPVDGKSPALYVQALYTEPDGQTTTGLDLYGADTMQKAQELAKILPTVNAITMPTDRLDKSIPRLPAQYPLTIHYYQLLFSGQLGFHLAAEFQNHPHLLGITLNDSGADESYSVFDHPTARIFVRDTPYPYTSQQLLQKLLAGVKLPAST